MDGSPLTHEFVNGHQVVIQGQGRFTKMRLTAGDNTCSVKGI